MIIYFLSQEQHAAKLQAEKQQLEIDEAKRQQEPQQEPQKQQQQQPKLKLQLPKY